MQAQILAWPAETWYKYRSMLKPVHQYQVGHHTKYVAVLFGWQGERKVTDRDLDLDTQYNCVWQNQQLLISETVGETKEKKEYTII